MGSARFPLLLLLGILFLASVSVSYGIAYWEMQNPSSYEMCIQSCKTEEEPYRHEACHTRCKIYRDPESEKQGSSHEHKGEHSESEKEEHDEHDLPWPQPQPFPQPHEKEREHKHDEEHEHHRREQRTRGKGSQTKDDEKEWKGQHRYQDAEEREREREKEKEGEGWESNLEPEPKSQRENNPFLFNSHRFKTVFKNQHGHIRVLETFDQHSEKLENLRDYRVAEILSEPNTLVLPLHSDADFFLVVLSGKALLILVNPDGRETYKLDEGDGIKIPAGTTFYFLNQQENQKLRILKLVVTFRRPGKFEHFFLSEYLRGFSENILEASFNSPYEEIHETLLQHEHEKEGVILKVSREHIRELSRHAKSSSRKTLSSKDNPFNLRSQDPIYSNKFGKFYEITPDKNPQLRDLDIFLSCVEINEGALLLPHYNSKATVILVANEGEAKIEVVGLKQQQQQGLGSEEVQRYSAKLSEGDIFAIPSSHPVTVKASSSDFHLLGIGINAENNQRNFLAGEKDNMMRQIHSEVKDIAFPGSGEEVDKLIRNQKESYFVDAQPQQREEDGKSKRGPLSSILGAFY